MANPTLEFAEAGPERDYRTLGACGCFVGFHEGVDCHKNLKIIPVHWGFP